MTRNKPTFEESRAEIEALLEKKRSRWQFKASVMMDFDDVKQKILTHIWQKWYQYDAGKSLGAWVNTIIKNQLKNIFRDCYMSTSPPCTECPCNLGDGMCSLYGVYSKECLTYAEWTKKKKFRHEARLPLPIENHKNEASSLRESSFDVESAAEILHKKILPLLTQSEQEIYILLHVKHISEEEAAKILGFRTSEPNRKNGYKRFRQVSKKAIGIAKTILIEDGIETLE